MKKHFWSLLLIFLTIFWSLFALLFKVDNWQSHDGNFHFERIYAATYALKQGHFPLRWSSILNYNCGLPVFNFYYPLLYHLAGVLGIFNISPVFSLKIVFVVFYIFGTTSMYYLIYHLVKSKSASFIAAVMFALNPYYLQLIFVRANPEILTYSLLPAILLLILKNKNIPLFPLLVFYFLSHNTTVLITLPLVLISLVYSFRKSNYKNYILIITFILSFLSSSFFLGPALLEKNFVKLGSNIAAEYQQHFPTFKQLVFSPWGWGYSGFGLEDGMSFKFGYLQFIVLGLGIILCFRRHRLILLVLPIIVTLFLTLSSSNFIWKIITPLQQLQYPWRFLGLAVFMVTLLAPFVYYLLPKKYSFIFLILVISASILGNRHHIQAIPVNSPNDYNRLGTTTIANELLPVNAVDTCYLDSQKLSYFPDAYTITDGQKQLSYHDCSGYLCLDSNNSTQVKQYHWQYRSTFVEKIFNLVSLVSVFVWLVLTFFKKKLHL